MSIFGPPQPVWDEWLALAARQREWEYRPLDPGVGRRFHGFPMNQGGVTRHVLLGRHDGRHLVAFQYEYDRRERSSVGDGSRLRTHIHAVVALHLGTPMPGLSVTPTGRRHGLGILDDVIEGGLTGGVLGGLLDGAVGLAEKGLSPEPGQDILVGDPAFDEAFTVRSPSPEFAWDVLTAVIPVLSRWQPMSWRLEGDSMVVHQRSELTMAHVDAILPFMDAVVDAIPEHVWTRVRAGRPETPR